MFQEQEKSIVSVLFFTAIVSGIYFFMANKRNDAQMYVVCAALGFGTGFWAIFVTMGAEQFGTNLRATAATTVPNMVRGSLPLINLMFVKLVSVYYGWSFVIAQWSLV